MKGANANNVNCKESLDFIVMSMWTFALHELCMSQLCETSFIKTTHNFYLDVLLTNVCYLFSLRDFVHSGYCDPKRRRRCRSFVVRSSLSFVGVTKSCPHPKFENRRRYWPTSFFNRLVWMRRCAERKKIEKGVKKRCEIAKKGVK